MGSLAGWVGVFLALLVGVDELSRGCSAAVVIVGSGSVAFSGSCGAAVDLVQEASRMLAKKMITIRYRYWCECIP